MRVTTSPDATKTRFVVWISQYILSRRPFPFVLVQLHQTGAGDLSSAHLAVAWAAELVGGIMGMAIDLKGIGYTQSRLTRMLDPCSLAFQSSMISFFWQSSSISWDSVSLVLATYLWEEKVRKGPSSKGLTRWMPVWFRLADWHHGIRLSLCALLDTYCSHNSREKRPVGKIGMI